MGIPRLSILIFKFVHFQGLKEMTPLTDLLAKLRSHQEVISQTCSPSLTEQLQTRYSQANQEVISLHESVDSLSKQLEHCLEMWEEYASQNESLSAQLSGLEETARTEFKLQSSLHEKELHVINAQVGFVFS